MNSMYYFCHPLILQASIRTFYTETFIYEKQKDEKTNTTKILTLQLIDMARLLVHISSLYDSKTCYTLHSDDDAHLRWNSSLFFYENKNTNI